MAEPVDEVANRLYGLPLEEFTRERDAAARELRKAKDRDTAAVIAKLPKPSQAAWAANALAREQRGLVDDLLAAGERLRDAQDAAVAGKGAGELRKAGAAERAAVDALVEAAGDLDPGGRRPTPATLERLRTTLHAAAADEEVREALDAGRLVEDVSGGGAWGLFGVGEGADEPATAKPRKSSRGPKPAAPSRGGKSAASRGGKSAAGPSARDAEAERKREERERKEREAREAAEREARQKLETELREARAERRSRDRELERAEKAAARAAERLEEAREQAEEAGAELESAREAADEARDHVARLEEQLD